MHSELRTYGKYSPSAPSQVRTGPTLLGDYMRPDYKVVIWSVRMERQVGRMKAKGLWCGATRGEIG